MDTKTVVSSRGQIVIPKFIRDNIGLHTGSQLLIHLREDKTLELHSVQNDITRFFGQGANKDGTAIDVDCAIEEAISENIKVIEG